MLHRCSVRIASFFVSTGHVQSELSDLCRFAIERRITTIFVFLVCTFVGVWFMPLSHLLTFTLFFIVPRKLVGGYHAKTPLRCALLTLFTMVMVGLLVKFLATSAFVSFLVVCASSTAIVLFCPLIVCPLNLQSKTNNQSPRKKAQKIIGAEIGLLLIGFAFGIDWEFLMCAALGMGCASISFVSINQKERGDLT